MELPFSSGRSMAMQEACEQGRKAHWLILQNSRISNQMGKVWRTVEGVLLETRFGQRICGSVE
jgi:hypothetical protein